MKWKPTASIVINGLHSSNLIDDTQSETLKSLINDGDSVQAFKLAHGIMVDTGWRVGWNKILREGSIIGWYGWIITTQPIRSAAVEIETVTDLWETCRRFLSSLWLQDRAESGDEFESSLGYLMEFGVNLLSSRLDPAGLELLQRLNADQREKPLIERWRWQGSAGMALLSDGGRFQVTRELVWARAIEASIDSDGRLDPQLRTILEDVSPDQSFITLPQGKIGKPVSAFIDRLEMYRLAKRELDGISLAVQAGKFPSVALEIWG